MDQFPLVRPPTDDLSPYFRHARLGRNTGLLRTSALGGATLFLGNMYPDSAQVSDERLIQYLDMPPQNARAWYYARLLQACAEARSTGSLELERGLRLEKLYWEQADDRWIDERLGHLINKTGETEAAGGHWCWIAPFKRYPSINWRAQHDVSVVRLLWVRSRPDMELLPGANLMRDVSCCTGRDWLSRCVNPNHFRLKNDLELERFTDRLRGVRGQYKPDGEPKSTVAWSARYTRIEDGVEVVYHPLCDGTMGNAVQQAFNSGLKRGTGYCPTCHKAQMKHHAMYPKVSKSLSTMERMQDIETKARWAVWQHNGHGGPGMDVVPGDGSFYAGPQVLPPEPEETVIREQPTHLYPMGMDPNEDI
jgi:hypothetical protein